MGGALVAPQGTTPTTHIIKPPIGDKAASMRRWICVKAWITSFCAWRWPANCLAVPEAEIITTPRISRAGGAPALTGAGRRRDGAAASAAGGSVSGLGNPVVDMKYESEWRSSGIAAIMAFSWATRSPGKIARRLYEIHGFSVAGWGQRTGMRRTSLFCCPVAATVSTPLFYDIISAFPVLGGTDRICAT